MKTTILVLAVSTVVVSVFFNGCAGPAVSQTIAGSPAGVPAASTPGAGQAVSAVKVKVSAQPFNFTGGPEADGLRVWVDLLDANGRPVSYSNVNMDVKLTITPMPPLCEAGLALYTDVATLKTSKGEALAVGAKGIKDIPWQFIDQSGIDEQQRYGELVVLVTLPDGKQIDGDLSDVPILP